jgi:hypothetical protein
MSFIPEQFINHDDNDDQNGEYRPNRPRPTHPSVAMVHHQEAPLQLNIQVAADGRIQDIAIGLPITKGSSAG